MASLNNLLIAIINKYMLDTYCLTIFSDLRLDLITDIPILQFSSKNLTSTILKSMNTGCLDYIISVRDFDDFLQKYDKSISLSIQRNGYRKLVFFPTRSNAKTRQSLIKILKHRASQFIPNILLILPNDCESERISIADCKSFDLATHKYVGESDHQSLVMLDRWNSSESSFVNGTDLFYDKISDLQGKIVRGATVGYIPYSTYNSNESIVTGLDGTDMKAALEFCKWINCTLDFVVDNDSWGHAYDNGSSYGVFGNVHMDKADIGFGCLYWWQPEYLLLDFTMQIQRSGVSCIAPSPLPYPRWLLPIIPFNTVIWSFVFASLLIGAVALYLTAMATSKPFSPLESAMVSFRIMLTQVPKINDQSRHLQQVIGWLLVLSVILTSIYSGNLSSAITVPKYYDPINTVEDLLESGIEWGGPSDAWITSIEESPDETHRRIIKSFKIYSMQQLAYKVYDRDYAFGIERLLGGHLAIGGYVNETNAQNLQLMQEDLYWDYVVFIARKSSPFTKKLNQLFSRIKQAGLGYIWETQVVLKYCNYNVQLAIKTSVGQRGNEGGIPRPLGIKFLQGPFFILCVGIFMSFIAFVIEIVLWRKKKSNLGVVSRGNQFIEDTYQE